MAKKKITEDMFQAPVLDPKIGAPNPKGPGYGTFFMGAPAQPDELAGIDLSAFNKVEKPTFGPINDPKNPVPIATPLFQGDTEQQTQGKLLTGAAGIGAGAKVVSDTVANPMFQIQANQVAGGLPGPTFGVNQNIPTISANIPTVTGGLLEGGQALTNNMVQGAGNIATNLTSPMFHGTNAALAVIGNTAGDVYKAWKEDKGIIGSGKAKMKVAIDTNNPELKKEAVNELALGTGKALADNATLGKYPELVADYAIKPTLNALGEFISEGAKKIGDVTDAVTESKLGQILGAILGGAGKVAKEAISMTAYGLPLDLASKGIGYIGEGLDKSMGTNMSDSISGLTTPAVGSASFVEPTLETYTADKAKLSPEDQAILTAIPGKAKDALPKLKELLKAQFDKKNATPTTPATPASVQNAPVGKPGMLSQIGSALSMTPEMRANTADFYKNYDKGYWDTVMARAVGQKDIGLPRIPQTEKMDRQEQINRRAIYGRQQKLLSDYTKLSKQNMNATQFWPTILDAGKRALGGDKAASQQIIVSVAKMMDPTGKLSDADVRQVAAGTSSWGTKIDEFIRGALDNTGALKPIHLKDIMNIAKGEYENAIRRQEVRREEFIPYGISQGVPMEDVIQVIQQDGFGPYGTDAEDVIKKNNEVYEKLFSGGAGTSDTDLDDVEKAWKKAFLDDSNNQITPDGITVLKSWQNDPKRAKMWQTEILPKLSEDAKVKLGI